MDMLDVHPPHRAIEGVGEFFLHLFTISVGLLIAVRKVQLNAKDPSSRNPSLDITFNTTGLEDTGWRTAQATGALAFMPYAESERYTSIYRVEEEFLKNQSQLSEDESSILGVIQKFHVGEGGLTKDAADALAEQFGIWQGHLLAVKIAARVLQEQQNAFLEGREPKHSLSESL